MQRVIEEGRAERIPDALEAVKQDLKALNSGVEVDQQEYDEVVAVKAPVPQRGLPVNKQTKNSAPSLWVAEGRGAVLCLRFGVHVFGGDDRHAGAGRVLEQDLADGDRRGDFHAFQGAHHVKDLALGHVAAGLAGDGGQDAALDPAPCW